VIEESALFDVEAYFRFQIDDNEKYWSRLGGRPDLTGKSVLDFGCGHGALSLDVAKHGARRVLGIDLSDQRIRFCREKTAPRAPDGVLEFRKVDVAAIDEPGGFDMVVSKDVLEHVEPLEPALQAMARLLKPGGTLRLGFSPLYFSPFGDHGELGTKLPWGHVLAGERRVLDAFNRSNRSSCRTLVEAGFNMRTPRQFFRAFDALGFKTEYQRINPAEGGAKSAMMKLFDVLRSVAALEPYVTVGIYIVLRKPG
jgi:SAM-dependent methyltransferase